MNKIGETIDGKEDIVQSPDGKVSYHKKLKTVPITQVKRYDIVQTPFGKLLVVNADFKNNTLHGYKVEGTAMYIGSAIEIFDSQISSEIENLRRDLE